MEIVDLGALKKKFAILISKLENDCSLTLDVINEKIINDPFFDFLENNQANRFMEESYSLIVRRLFNMDVLFDSETKYDQTYWAAYQYLNIALNLLIPLRTIFLLCPLKEMVAHFTIYHEMNEFLLVKEFLDNEYHRSILKRLRLAKSISADKLAKLTGISVDTIHYLEDNNHLYRTSFTNINNLSTALDCSLIFFKKEMNISVISRYLYQDSDFQNIFSDETKTILRDSDLKIIYDYLNENDIKKQLKNGDVLTVNTATTYYKKNSSSFSRVPFDQNLLDSIIRKSIRRYLLLGNKSLAF